jgi:hypothetical protein
VSIDLLLVLDYSTKPFFIENGSLGIAVVIRKIEGSGLRPSALYAEKKVKLRCFGGVKPPPKHPEP